MTKLICFTTIVWKGNNNMMLKKWCSLSTCNNAKSECLIVTNVRRVAVYVRRLKLVNKEAGAHLSSKENA